MHGHLCVLFTLILPFYFLLYLPSLFFFLLYLKSVVNLHNSTNESMDSTEEFSLSTGYEPKAHDLYETSVEPYMQLLDSPPLFSNKVSSADPDCDDATLEDMLHQAHRAQAYHSLQEDLSVSLSSSSMSDRTGRPVRGERPAISIASLDSCVRASLFRPESRWLSSALIVRIIGCGKHTFQLQ